MPGSRVPDPSRSSGRPDGTAPPSQSTESPPPAPPLRRPRERGFSAPSVALLSLALTVGAGALDGLTSGELGRWFALGFVISAVGGAVTIRRSDLLWSLIWPPLVFATAVVLTAPVVPGGSGGNLKRQGIELATSLALEAPLLVGTTLTAAGVALARVVRGRFA